MKQKFGIERNYRHTIGADGKYKIVRNYFRGGHRVIERGLTLEEAQAHCRDPETSSSTAKSAIARRRTQQKGAWFDGYDRD